jgi:hypothetical protein
VWGGKKSVGGDGEAKRILKVKTTARVEQK